MTNDKKTSEIIIKIQNSSSLDYDGRLAKYMYDSAMQMAEWKDKQFIEALSELQKTVEDLRLKIRIFIKNYDKREKSKRICKR